MGADQSIEALNVGSNGEIGFDFLIDQMETELVPEKKEKSEKAAKLIQKHYRRRSRILTSEQHDQIDFKVVGAHLNALDTEAMADNKQVTRSETVNIEGNEIDTAKSAGKKQFTGSGRIVDSKGKEMATSESVARRRDTTLTELDHGSGSNNSSKAHEMQDRSLPFDPSNMAETRAQARPAESKSEHRIREAQSKVLNHETGAKNQLAQQQAILGKEKQENSKDPPDPQVIPSPSWHQTRDSKHENLQNRKQAPATPGQEAVEDSVDDTYDKPLSPTDILERIVSYKLSSGFENPAAKTADSADKKQDSNIQVTGRHKRNMIAKEDQRIFTSLVQHGGSSSHSELSRAKLQGSKKLSKKKTLCQDTCKYAKDGSCDDGGDGATYTICELGTDCSDCGKRHHESDNDPNRGELDGKGSSPGIVDHHLQSRRNTLCSNLCKYSHDNTCDDGGDLESQFAMCDFGTDCADCGPRSPRVTHKQDSDATPKAGSAASASVERTIDNPNLDGSKFATASMLHPTPFKPSGAGLLNSINDWKDDSKGFLYVGDTDAKSAVVSTSAAQSSRPKPSWTSTKDGGVVVSANGDADDKILSSLKNEEGFKFHTAKYGDSISSVCQRYGTPIFAFLLWNGDLLQNEKMTASTNTGRSGMNDHANKATLIEGEVYLVSMPGMPASINNNLSPSICDQKTRSNPDNANIPSPTLVKVKIGAPVFAQWTKDSSVKSSSAQSDQWIQGKVEQKLDGLFLVRPSTVENGEARWLRIEDLGNVEKIDAGKSVDRDSSLDSHVLVMRRSDDNIRFFEGTVSDWGTSLSNRERLRVLYSTDGGKTKKSALVPMDYVFKYRASFPPDLTRVVAARRAIVTQSLALFKDAMEPVPFWLSGDTAKNWKSKCDSSTLAETKKFGKIMHEDDMHFSYGQGIISIGIHYLDFDEASVLKKLRSRGFIVEKTIGNRDGIHQQYSVYRPFYCNNLLQDEETYEMDRRSVEEFFDCKHAEKRRNSLRIRIRIRIFFDRENGGIVNGLGTSYEESMQLVWVDVEGRRFRIPSVSLQQ